MNLRQVNLTGETAGIGFFNLSGFIDEATGQLNGTLSLVEDPNNITTEAVTGTIAVLGSTPEDLPIAPVSATPALAVLGSAQIAADGSTAVSLTGTTADGSFFGVILKGSTTAFAVEYETPQPAGSGLEVINGVSIDNPCVLADQLRTVRLQLIAGQSVSRTEFSGRSLYFHRADLEELTKEIARLDAECAIATGVATTTTPDLTARTRRQIRINPYS